MKKGKRIVGVIAVRPKGLSMDAYNPLVLFWTINPYRKDLEEVIAQSERNGQPKSYANSLVNSMFKNWGTEDEPTGAKTKSKKQPKVR